MSDTDRPALNSASHMYVHYCEEDGCKEWGGFGFSPTRAVPSRWWCWGHYPHKTYEQEKALRERLNASDKAEKQ
ncbi:hypothetical protein [Rhizobium sp. NZLR1b]|uniref:hypothetical protein n=1 Tax=Rhizobium sp. NZLR1b TaxID=2731099 RepID=UPI003865ABF7